MALADELLELAQRLVDLDGDEPREATARRAISTAYYALFHLLVAEGTLNWNRPEFRPSLGRMFEHGQMRSASAKIISHLNRKGNATSEIEPKLRQIATVFIDAQRRRNEADYLTSSGFTRSNVQEQIDAVAWVFVTWHEIRNEPAAQAYLVAMLSKRSTP